MPESYNFEHTYCTKDHGRVGVMLFCKNWYDFQSCAQ